MKREISIILLCNCSCGLLQIFDSSGNILVNDYVSFMYKFEGIIGQCYSIRFVTSDSFLCSSFIITLNNYIYIFDLRFNLFHHIFIKLVDRNYDKLEIKKGEIILWQNRIT